MKQLGLIGISLGHSFSPGYFASKFKREGILGWRYDAYPIPKVELFPGLWELHPELVGLNVTIPYKQTVIPYLDGLDDAARAIGAVNTIKKMDGKLWGYNTDAIGFEKSLRHLLGDARPKRTLILGTGGSAKAVAYVLDKMDMDFRHVSRKKTGQHLIYPELNADIISKHQLIVNTTPLGMYPNIQTCPYLPYSAISPEHYAMDLVYNPEKTLFLNKATQQKAKTLNGLMMLHEQAEAAWTIWGE